MPRFFFHLSTPEGFQQDELGGDFADIETAYLDAWSAALEISFEMLRDRRDPTPCQFEIVDEQGRFLMEVPFSEVLRPTRPPSAIGAARAAIQQSLARNRVLRAEIREEFDRTKMVLSSARATLQRSRALC